VPVNKTKKAAAPHVQVFSAIPETTHLPTQHEPMNEIPIEMYGYQSSEENSRECRKMRPVDDVQSIQIVIISESKWKVLF
jgi:hypothetical protein